MVSVLGGADRTRVILVLAAVLALNGADIATVGASATSLRRALGIHNTDIGLLVTVSSLVAAFASLPFGVLADRTNRTRVLGAAVALWGGAMIWGAGASNFEQLVLSRVFLGVVTAAAGPMIASLVGDYFPASERGRIYSFILAGELAGTGFGLAVTGDIAAISWRAAFLVLAVPAFVLAWLVLRLPEPERGGTASLNARCSSSDDGGDGASPTDAQLIAQEDGISADPDLVLRGDTRSIGIVSATRHVLRVRTNIVLIASSACGYYFLAGVQTFGVEFSKDQFGIGQASANGLLLIVGLGALLGVLAGGFLGDALVRRRHLSGRILTSAVATSAAVGLFLPALLTHDLLSAVPYLVGAAFMLSAQNPPLDAARLDIMPSQLWGRAESIRSVLRSLAQALAPLIFGFASDHVFGGGRTGLQRTFGVMLLPLAASAGLLFFALTTYPRDVASAAASVLDQTEGEADTADLDAS